jgi:hypothetical protein
MRKKPALVAGILAGMSSPGSLFTSPPDYPRLRGSDMDRIRGDVLAVGADFKKVITREHGKAKQK